MAGYITYNLKNYRLVVREEWGEQEDVCAYCGAGSLKTGYVKGKSVSGYDFSGQFTFQGLMCYQCMWNCGLLKNPLTKENHPECTTWSEAIFSPDPPFKQIGSCQHFDYGYKPCRPSWKDCGQGGHTPGPDCADCREAASDLGCDLPPAGYFCTRMPGHSGPCATLPKPGYVKYKFKFTAEKPPERQNKKRIVAEDFSWPERGITAISRARYALNRLFGKRGHSSVEEDILRQEFRIAFDEGMTAGQEILLNKQKIDRERVEREVLHQHMKLEQEAKAYYSSLEFGDDVL